MSLFNTALKVLLICCAAFFAVFSYICLLWTEREPKEPRNIIGAMLISLLMTSKILLIGFGLLIVVSLLVKYFA